MLAGLGQPIEHGVVVEPGLRSKAEDRWRELASRAGGGQLALLRDLDIAFVTNEAEVLGGALGRLLSALDEDGQALVVGHSPTNEAAVLGLTGQLIEPLAKGAGVRIVMDGGRFSVERV